MGYQFTGPSAISSLTYPEILHLQLGWLVRQDQQRDAMDGEGGGGHRRTQPRMSTQEAKQEYQRRYGGAQPA